MYFRLLTSSLSIHLLPFSLFSLCGDSASKLPWVRCCKGLAFFPSVCLLSTFCLHQSCLPAYPSVLHSFVFQCIFFSLLSMTCSLPAFRSLSYLLPPSPLLILSVFLNSFLFHSLSLPLLSMLNSLFPGLSLTFFHSILPFPSCCPPYYPFFFSLTLSCSPRC